MNSATLTTLAGQMLAVSSAVLITGFVLHWLLRRRSAAQRELIWRTAFIVIALLPVTWLLRPWGLIRQESGLPATRLVTVVPDSLPVTATDIILSAPASVSSPPSVSPAAILFSLWAAGALLLLVRLLLSTRLRSKWLAGARRCETDKVLALWNRMTGTAGVRLLVSPACPVPLTWGRVVMLPQDALTWSEEQLRAALQHEMAHMMCRDWAFRRAGEFAAALFWPQPLVWLARSLWHRMQEQACDDSVIRSGSDTAAYAELLCHAARAWTIPSAGAMAMAQPSSLEKRILAVMNPACNRKPCTWSSVLAAVLLGLAAFTTAALAQKPADSPVKPAPAPVAPAPSAVEVKASKIILPRVVFNEASVRSAIAFLSAKAKELDPDKKGIAITGPANPPVDHVTLDLRNASLWHVLNIVAEQTGTRIEAGPDGITFNADPAPKKAPFENHAIARKAQGIILERVLFENATVDEMVDYVRKKSMEADKTPGKSGLNITTKDAGSKTYSLSLRNVSAWEALDQIAKVAGMHGVGINVTNDGTESLLLDRSVIDLRLSAEVAKSPQYRALERLKIAGLKAKTTLAEAASALSRDIAAAPGGMQMAIKIAPAIANEPYDAESPSGPATVRLIILTGIGKHELTLDGDGFLIRPRAKK